MRWLYWPLFTAVMGFALGSAIAVASTERYHVHDSNQPHHPSALYAQTEPKSEPRATAHADSDPQHRSQKEGERCEYYGPEWFKGFYCLFSTHDKFVVAFGTLILAAGTTILGFATVFLWRATRELVMESREASAKQVLASRMAAEAAIASNEIAAIAAERQLRPYLHFLNGEVAFRTEDGRLFCNVVLNFKNSGVTPARILDRTISTEIQPKGRRGPIGTQSGGDEEVVMNGLTHTFAVLTTFSLEHIPLEDPMEYAGGIVIGIRVKYSAWQGRTWVEDTWLQVNVDSIPPEGKNFALRPCGSDLGASRLALESEA
jgi:hypothetical protein